MKHHRRNALERKRLRKVYSLGGRMSRLSCLASKEWGATLTKEGVLVTVDTRRFPGAFGRHLKQRESGR